MDGDPEAHPRARDRAVARPSSVWAYCRRQLSEWWYEARHDWRRSWDELRGVRPSEMDVLLDRMKEARGW